MPDQLREFPKGSKACSKVTLPLAFESCRAMPTLLRVCQGRCICQEEIGDAVLLLRDASHFTRYGSFVNVPYGISLRNEN